MSVCLLFLLVLLVDYDHYCGTPWTFLQTLCLSVCCTSWFCWWTMIIIVELPGPFYLLCVCVFVVPLGTVGGL